MPAPGWDTLAVKDETKAAYERLKGIVVETSAGFKELRTEDDLAAAGAVCLEKHAIQKTPKARRRQ
jgi:hypothetical protein